MTAFWILACGLLALAGRLVLPTLLGRRDASGPDRAALNRALYRRELAELDAALTTGELDEMVYGQARAELERRVLETAPGPAGTPAVLRPGLGRLAALTLAVTVPVIAVAGYTALGSAAAILASADADRIVAAPHPGGDPQGGNAPPVDRLTEGLAARLRDAPDDPAGWLLLARAYRHLGRTAEARVAYAEAHARGADDAELAALLAAPATPAGDALAALQARVATAPDDGDTWRELARARQAQRDFTAAAAAYAKARALLPEDAGLLADHADALAATQDRRLAGEPERLVERALRLDPDHPKALWLAATAALQRDDTARARSHWEHLQRLLPEDAPDRRVIDRNLAALDGSGGPVTTEAGTPAAPVRVYGRVDISPALRARVADDDTVFVFARAVDGPRMPLAVLRKRVRDLPFEFSLDDSLAMQPRLKLSGFDRVVVGARVSRDGSVAQQSGEPRGEFGPVPTRGGAAVRLLIDEPAS